MKYRHGAAKDVTAWPSLPARGAWIEMTAEACIHTNRNYSRSPHGERGLKFILPSRSHSGGSGRSPHGERGLKWRRGVKCKPAYESLPARGAWIEMSDDGVTGYGTPGSLPARGAWIEIAFLPGCATFFVSLPARGAWIEIVPIDSILRKRGRSLPARGAWIEILTEKHELFRGAVAPRTGSVD